MEEMRRMMQGPVFQYKGYLVSCILYYKGNNDLVHSWDIAIKGLNLSKAMPDELRKIGFTEADLSILDAKIQSWVDSKEGR